MIDGSSIHGFRVFRPPRHAALVGAEAFLLCSRSLTERAATVGTSVSSHGSFLLYRNADVISAAVGLDGVFGYAEIGGDSGVAVAFAA